MIYYILENNKKEAKGFSDSYHVKVTQEVSTKNAKKFLENNKHLITQPPSHFRYYICFNFN